MLIFQLVFNVTLLKGIFVGMCYICNMGRSDLPDTYVRMSTRACSARGRVRTYQANHNCAWYICYVTLPAY